MITSVNGKSVSPGWLPILVAICCLFHPASLATTDRKPPDHLQNGASIDVDVRKVKKRISPYLRGANVDWPPDGNQVWDSTRNRMDPEVMRLARNQGVTLVRFPGGALVDSYHWHEGIGPVDKRPKQPVVAGGRSVVSLVGIDEILQFCEQIGARALLQVNVTSGSSQEAADLVAYCNQPNNAERRANGHPAPYGVKFFEVGNEQYMAPDPHDKGGALSRLTPVEYARRFVEFAKAMKAVDPTVYVGGIGGKNADNNYLIKDPRWNETLLRQGGHYIDFLSVHNAYAPVVAVGADRSAEDIYKAMLAAPVLIAQNLADLRGDVERFAPADAERIKLAVTEWGPLFHVLPSSRWVDHAKTLGSALYMASTMNAMIQAPTVDFAAYYKLKDEHFLGTIGLRNIPKVSYYAMQMYAKHCGPLLLASTVRSPSYDSLSIGCVAALKNVPCLDVCATTDDAHKHVYFIVVNKSLDSKIEATINLANFHSATRARTWTLTADAIDANNGPDLKDIPFPLSWAKQANAQYSEFENGTPNTVIPLGATIDVAPSFKYIFPARSITALEFDGL